MSIRDFSAQRLFVDAPLSARAVVAGSAEQTNYLRNVLRSAIGDELLLFNGRDGEWRARISGMAKRTLEMSLIEQTRPQSTGPDIDYLFAPLKRARLDFMVQKAAELGVRRLRPVLTRHTLAERVKLQRMRANAIEAAEQCGILHVPDVLEPVKLERVIDGWLPERRVVFCDEGAAVTNPIAALSGLGRGPLAVLIGPEGGFSPDERELLRAQPFVTAISLGPRIMRADTAAIAALALVNAVLGDW